MSRTRPQLRQAADLTPADLERYPVWVCVHGRDQEEPWYDETDEATYRPWTGPQPVSPAQGQFLVRGIATLANGRCYPAMLYPVDPSWTEDPIGLLQSVVFVEGQPFAFWGGILGIAAGEQQAFYRAVDASAEAVFPMSFAALPGLTGGIQSGIVPGFLRLDPDPSDEKEDLVMDLVRAGQFGEALALATQRMEEHPNDPERWRQLRTIH